MSLDALHRRVTSPIVRAERLPAGSRDAWEALHEGSATIFSAGRWWGVWFAIATATASCGPKATGTVHSPAGDARVLLDTPFEVQTGWSKTCDDSSIFDHNSSGADHRYRCELQDYGVAIECSSACDVSAGDTMAGTGTVTVTPQVQGPLSLTAVMDRRQDTMKKEVEKYLADWLYRPIAELRGAELVKINCAGEVGPISDLRQQVHDGNKHARFPVEDVHTLRRTYESVAHEVGIIELDQHVLTNHAFASHNVNAMYIAQALPHLARCQATIEAALWKRIEPKRRAARRA